MERGTYDRLECTAKYQIYPILGGKVVGDITSADIKALLNHWMNEGYAYTTVKKVYNILTDYFRYLTQQEYIPKNPMAAAPMIKKSNFMASQGKEDLPTSETVTIFTPEEIAKFKAEALQTWGNGTRIYQQAAAYTLMLNTGLRTGEALGLLNSDIDLENRVLHLQRGVKEISRREGSKSTSGREVKVGKLKTASSKRDVPLNQAVPEGKQQISIALFSYLGDYLSGLQDDKALLLQLADVLARRVPAHTTAFPIVLMLGIGPAILALFQKTVDCQLTIV